MRTLLFLGLLVSTLLFCPPSSHGSQTEHAKETPAEQKEIREAFQQVLQWLNQIDENKYEASWDNASSYFKKIVPKKKWVTEIRAVRKPLGRASSRRERSHRKLTGIPGAPNGIYIVFQIDTQFQSKPQAIETVTPVKRK